MLKYFYLILVWLTGILTQIWAAGVIYYCSFPEDNTYRGILSVTYLFVVLVFIVLQKKKTKALFKSLVGYIFILIWFSSIKVNPDAVYPEHLQTTHAEIKGNRVVIHKVRNNNYRTRDDFDVHYETREYDLNNLKTVDLLVNYWGIEAVAHTFLSFGFTDGQYISVSIGIRPEVGEEYGMLKGFFKQFELIYEWADERDLIRLRTNYRGEEAYLYRVELPPEKVQTLFLSMLRRTNRLHQKPEFYNTLFQSCTNTIGDHIINEGIYDIPFYKRRFLSGDIDQRMYKEGLLMTFDLPFKELRQKANIVERANVVAPVSTSASMVEALIPKRTCI